MIVGFIAASMTVTFLLVGASYVLAEWLDSRRKRPWWRESKGGDVVQVGRKRLW